MKKLKPIPRLAKMINYQPSSSATTSTISCQASSKNESSVAEENIKMDEQRIVLDRKNVTSVADENIKKDEQSIVRALNNVASSAEEKIKMTRQSLVKAPSVVFK